ncbi:flagellin [Pseudoalteromonas nigrifaciens]
MGNNAISGASAGYGVEATDTLAASATTNVATDATFAIQGPTGNATIGITEGDLATATAAAINSANTGVKAETTLTTTLSNLTSADDGTLSIGGDDFTLNDYNGDMKKLASDMAKAGYDATYNTGTDAIDISAKNVDGIQITGAGAGTAQLGAVVAGGTNENVSVSAELSLSSSEDFTVTGATVDDILNIAAAGGSSTLDSVALIDISGTNADGAQSAIEVIDAALGQIDSQRADLGAVQNRFGHTISNLANISENVSASRSRIQDTDFATETAQMTKNQILQQAGTSILAQANQLPQAALSLIG